MCENQHCVDIPQCPVVDDQVCSGRGVSKLFVYLIHIKMVVYKVTNEITCFLVAN